MASAAHPAPRPQLGEWLNERLGLKGLAYAVPEHANSLPYLLGGITFTGFIILIVTGIYLAQFYHPHPADAHQSVVYIITGAPLGDLVRSIHFWTAQIVIVTVLLHMLRVLFTGSYKRPREINWYVGLGLFAVTLGLVFTGSVLKFDQEGIEALQHNKEAANVIGSLGAWFSTEFSRTVPLLTRLFNGHITILPLIFGLLIAAHIYLIKQHGISPKVTPDAVSHATTGEGSSRFNVHLLRMVGYGLFVLALALLLSLLIPAPLGQPGVAGAEVTKPWWMFVWLFPAEEAWGVQALVILPAILATLLALVPILDRSPYMSLARRKVLLIVAGLILVTIVISGVVATLQPVAAHLD
ncbi:MAG TPA: cytochrome b N-terminal domain-containing protein [Anaerolineae bacterium]|nr:cytochrome b N-terminal domain-containing protein [Anaerolineae bacterium]